MRAFIESKIPRPFTIDFRFAQISPSLPLDLEIGAGQGLHAIRYCQTHRDRQLLAVEKTHNRFAKLASRRLSHPELSHLHIVQADAVALVTHHLPPSSVERLFILYPNPYPKAKQANLRWHNRPFMRVLLERLKEGGELELATNQASYAREAEAGLQQIWGLTKLSVEPIAANALPRTHFERKYLQRGEVCWNLKFCKTRQIEVQ